MLTTTVDGLWVLQVLSGIETLAPELGLRPILPSVETAPEALAHPITEELRAAGVIDDAGAVDSVIVEWLTVLSRRDVALMVQIIRPEGEAPAVVTIARFAQWWVVLERSAELIRISAAGSATTETAAQMVISAQIERLCGTLPPADFRPVSIDTEAFRQMVTDRETLREFLMEQGLDPEQLRIAVAATDLGQSAQASMVALQTGVDSGPAFRTHIGASAATILDTVQGRLLVEQITSAEKEWMVISPGTMANIGAAAIRLLAQLPASDQWYAHRKVV